jgi:hypothetical protein
LDCYFYLESATLQSARTDDLEKKVALSDLVQFRDLGKRKKNTSAVAAR